jgi:hypothetical protein
LARSCRRSTAVTVSQLYGPVASQSCGYGRARCKPLARLVLLRHRLALTTHIAHRYTGSGTLRIHTPSASGELALDDQAAGNFSSLARSCRRSTAVTVSQLHHTHRTSLYRFGNAEDTYTVLTALYPAPVALLSPGQRAYRRREVALKGFNEGASRRALEPGKRGPDLVVRGYTGSGTLRIHTPYSLPFIRHP